jgi:hypothetical protein
MRQTKIWTGLGLVAAAGLAASGAKALDFHASPGKTKLLWLAASSGEGGESAAANSGGPDARVAFLTRAGLAEGHIRVALELYRLGEKDAARSHMKHSADEPLKGFGDALAALSNAVDKDAGQAEVDAKWQALQASIAAARGKLEAPDVAQAVVGLSKVAAEEYGASVKNGKVTDAHEYQDAWGFVQAALAMLANLSDAERTEHAVQIPRMEARLKEVQNAWPDLTGKAPVNADPKSLAAAASFIELMASAIK